MGKNCAILGAMLFAWQQTMAMGYTQYTRTGTLLADVVLNFNA